jgi:hypothetical protein
MKKTIVGFVVFIIIMVFILMTQSHAGPPAKYKTGCYHHKNCVTWYYQSQVPMPPTMYYPMLPPNPYYAPRPLPCPIIACVRRIVSCPFRILRGTADALFDNLY